MVRQETCKSMLFSENRLAEGRKEFLHSPHRRNLLHFASCVGQINYAGRIFLDDLVALRVA